MEDLKELQAKIAKYEADLTRLRSQLETLSDDTFERIRATEIRSTMRDYEQRIARLQERVAGVAQPGPTDEMIRIADWVNSPEYDNE